MASLNFLEARYYASEGKVGRVVDDTPVAIRISHPGTEAVTSVTVTTATNIVLIDADATSTLAFSSYTTVGTLADAINALDNWECKVLDGLRADATANKFVNGAITLAVINGETVWDVLTDTSGLKAVTYRCTYDRNVDISRPSGSHRVKLYNINYNVNINAASANGVRVYEWDSENKTETQVWQATSVDVTDTSHTFTQPITAGEGNDLIVRVIDGTSVTDGSANFLQCTYVKE